MGLECRKIDGVDGVELLSCTDADRPFPKHVHDAYCIWLNSAGGESFWYAGKSAHLSPGSFGMVNPGEVHANAGTSAIRHLRTFYLDTQYVSRIAERMEKRTPEYFSAPISENHTLYQNLYTLHADANTLDPFSAECATTEVFGSLLVECAGAHSSLPSADERRVKRVIDMMRSSLAQQHSLDTFAEQVGVGGYHLIRMFRAVTGVPPHQYLLHLRLAYVRSLLKQGVTPSQAAVDAGFHDQSHMHRKFTAVYGITPGRYANFMQDA